MKTKFATKSVAVFAALLVSALCALALPLRAAVIDAGAFAYRASFTVSGYAGSAPLENFPVLVRLSATSPSGFDYAACAADGSDLRFSDADGNVIPHEIEAWDTAGESLVWVKLPELDVGTTFSMWYGGAVVQTLHFKTKDWTGFEAAYGAGASLIATEFGDAVATASQWKPTFTLPTDATASDVVVAAVKATPEIGWWLATTSHGSCNCGPAAF